MEWFDTVIERSARHLARNTSRRSALARIGTVAVGAASLPLLPVARAESKDHSMLGDADGGDPNDPLSCDYWRFCAMDGFLCGCCGGDTTSCPPGTEPSVLAWLGTCKNPTDGKDYVISYRDCCGKSSCGRCMCYRHQDEMPTYQPSKSNDIDWCIGSRAGLGVNCTMSVVVGTTEANTG
jgi:methylamine dehydrogenase light chain